MPGRVKLSVRQLCDQAVRWRDLAAEATTPQARGHLIKLAQQCEFLASGLASANALPIEDAQHRAAEVPDAAG